STDKSYPGDNRLISPKSSHRRGGLAPRCRLIASWGCSRSQGLGCSPIKAVRELGSERRETVRSLSVVGAGSLRTEERRCGQGRADVAGSELSTDKSDPGDNRLISPKSSHRRGGLAPRCRLIASWGCSRSQGLGCSPIKAVRELGSERRETVRSLSVVGVGSL